VPAEGGGFDLGGRGEEGGEGERRRDSGNGGIDEVGRDV